MTAFAGLFALSGTLPEAITHNALARLIDRTVTHRQQSFTDGRLHVTKIDIGAYPTPSFHEDNGGLTLTAGDPILGRPNENVGDRTHACQLIHSTLGKGDLSALQASRGTFCGLSYFPKDQALYLFTDRLGVRPLFYTEFSNVLYFSTSLRALAALTPKPLELDLVAAIEYATFNYSLEDRTRYLGIQRLPAGSVLRSSKEVARTRYFSLHAKAEGAHFTTKQEGLDALYTTFQDAIRSRLHDSTDHALLSGGLDSRVVVTALTQLNREPHCYTFGEPSTLDIKIATQYAQRLNLPIITHPFEPCHFGPGWPLLAARLMNPDKTLENPTRLLWTGDGGSVGLGRTYITTEIESHLSTGNFRLAAESFCKPFQARILRRAYRPMIKGTPTSTVERLIRKQGACHPVNRMFAFLMENDQARHLDEFYENIDLYNIELLTPLYDAELVVTTLSFEPTYPLYHRMYNDWLDKFPTATKATPWQPYPGHIPGPAPLPPNSDYQWEPKQPTFDTLAVRELAQMALGRAPLSITNLVAATMACRLRVKDLTWVAEQARKIHHLTTHLGKPNDSVD
ncbi:hypothetical protein LRB11_05225 [Ectothiorhodospira haloalkaliphila]|uniref:asparagine synthase-related protein n=1 Tax=Ectothiorhodospira haloalkaliphila TaxID=421628 RepID=UPI001EE9A9BC|nr:asparagine synthase-related protein [Ectothiorhodospira haloalkaliphila]MCG5524332.1 hypothetical protein [Ectothiorhodospira haloalkaliphila]